MGDLLMLEESGLWPWGFVCIGFCCGVDKPWISIGFCCWCIGFCCSGIVDACSKVAGLGEGELLAVRGDGRWWRAFEGKFVIFVCL